ncbi:MAG: preprotein translocase subunit Sec61beta [Candidatus Nanoarchaeia archaeon]
MADGGISMPSGSGGLMRYNEEYDSRIKLKPEHVILLVAATVIFVYALKIFF